MKDQKFNASFDNGSQCNLSFESSLNELGLKTHDLVQPCSLGWIQEKSIMRIVKRCKIIFSINGDYDDEVE